MRTVIEALKGLKKLDALGIIALIGLILLIAHAVYIDIRRDGQIRQMIDQNERTSVALERLSQEGVYQNKIIFPRVKSQATKTDILAVLGTYEKIANDAINQRDQEIETLKAKTKEKVK